MPSRRLRVPILGTGQEADPYTMKYWHDGGVRKVENADYDQDANTVECDFVADTAAILDAIAAENDVTEV